MKITENLSFFKNFRKYFEYLVHVLFISLIILIISYNYKNSLYIFNGWSVSIVETPIYQFFLGLILSIIFIYSTKINLSDTIYKYLTIVSLLIGLVFRIVLATSIEGGPAGDAWALFESVNGINTNSIGPFLKGGYISTYLHQLGGLTIMRPLIAIFKYDFQSLIIINGILLWLSSLLIVLTVKIFTSWKNGWVVSILLLIFMPLHFYLFMVYIEPYGILIFSLILYFLSVELSRKKVNIIYLIFLVFIGTNVRLNLAILTIAVVLYYLIMKAISKKNLLIITLLLFTLSISNKLLIFSYNVIYDLNLGSYSMPFSANLAMGTSGVGFSNEYINILYNNDFDVEKLNEYNYDKIRDNLETYFENGTFLTFLESKFIYSWTDQDFDSMNYMLPNNFNYTFEDFKKDNSLRLGRAIWSAKPLNAFGEWLYRSVFRIRDLEKVIYFMTLFISLFFNIINFRKRNSELRLVLEMFVLGTTIVFLFVETQPRYLLMSYIAIIVQTGLLVSSINLKDDKIDLSEDPI